jgi:hypothetical protein
MNFKSKILWLIPAFCFSVVPAHAQWTGCGFGAGAAMFMTQAEVASPVSIGTDGQKAGVTLNCDYRAGAFVFGGEFNYDWVFGNASTVGVENDFSALGRLGVLTSRDNLLYAVAGWGRSDVTFGSTNLQVDSWRIGLGDEFRIPNSPAYLDMRLLYVTHDEKDISPSLTGLKINSLEAGLRLKFKFGPGMFGGSGPLFTNEVDPVPAGDSKIMGPKKH